MAGRARAVGINHVALTVGDIDAALEFYGRFVAFELRGRVPGGAFLDLGDQFLALGEGEAAGDAQRHFGLVVDDKEAVRAAVRAAGIDVRPSGHLRFRDPWGNAIEIVDYRDVQFTKSPEVLAGMGLDDLEKTPSALRELADKGLAG
jgi:lactoylglutathione lyase